MLQYSTMRYKHIESTREQMLTSFAEFILKHCSADFESISKQETFCGNVHCETFFADDNAEFKIITTSFYNHCETTWNDSESSIMFHFTENF